MVKERVMMMPFGEAIPVQAVTMFSPVSGLLKRQIRQGQLT